MATEGGLEYKTYTFQSGAVYEGTFKGSKRHGRGHWRHPEGEIYEGEYSENKQHGKGVYIFGSTGKRYVGHWVAGEMSGEGVYYFAPGNTTFYSGSYDRDKKHGNGFYLYENGVLTCQTWVAGDMRTEVEATPIQYVECAKKVRDLFIDVRAVAPRELGAQPDTLDVKTFQFPSGATYTGQYYGTRKQGQGYWVHPDGDSYGGQYEDNRHAGWGVYITGRSGKKYVGQWAEGKMNGWGVYFFNPQETEYFVGSYKGDQKDGRGLYHFAESNRSKVQVWENGVLKHEADADEKTVLQYLAAIKKLIEIVQPYAPNYQSVAFR
jgi:hypothetical protein